MTLSAELLIFLYISVEKNVLLNGQACAKESILQKEERKKVQLVQDFFRVINEDESASPNDTV